MSKSKLENFEALQQNKYTEPLLFIPGEYKLSQVGRVPYLVAVMSLEDLVNQIKLVEDIPEEARLDWSLEELFQRDISWDRVRTELVNGYLKDPNKLSFFNSLTIALLPQKGLEIEESYGKPESSPSASYPKWNQIDVGNIRIEYIPDRSIGVVRWHKERVFPVAIDGQHRLAALKQYYEEVHLTPGVSLETKIPLIILILDERVGFEGRSEKSLIGTLREIFIDLNKNAREVPKSRLILLEDLNIQSFCVRTLLASKAKESSSDVLPLPMVTWREDEAKFDSGYAITSVLNLNEIVGYCLGRRSIEEIDRLDESQVRGYVDQINAKLELGTETQESIKKHLQSRVGREEPFSFTDEHLAAFREAFRKQWTPHIIRVFWEFGPYKKYFSEAKQIGAIDGMLADYLLLPEEEGLPQKKAKRERFKERKKAEDETFNPKLEIDAPLETLENLKENEWAFYVVFQKALFINLFELETQRPSLFNDEIGESRNGFMTWWIAQMNALYDCGVFNLDWKEGKGNADLWLGIANNPVSGTIQYSKAAANRISAFITICIWFNNDSTQEDVNAFAESLIGDSDRLPVIVRNAFKNRGMVKEGLESLVKARIDHRQEDDEEKLARKVKREIKKELVKRLKAIQG